MRIDYLIPGQPHGGKTPLVGTPYGHTHERLRHILDGQHHTHTPHTQCAGPYMHVDGPKNRSPVPKQQHAGAPSCFHRDRARLSHRRPHQTMKHGHAVRVLESLNALSHACLISPADGQLRRYPGIPSVLPHPPSVSTHMITMNKQLTTPSIRPTATMHGCNYKYKRPQ